MTVQLNHTIVPAKNSKESAAFLAEVLGLPDPFPFGPFVAVQVDSLTLDYIDVDTDDREIPYWADPHASRPQEINTNDGGRGCYFADPSGHWLEILTRPYGSGSNR